MDGIEGACMEMEVSGVGAWCITSLHSTGQRLCTSLYIIATLWIHQFRKPCAVFVFVDFNTKGSSMGVTT
jgi:hypothetical protein